MKHQVPPMIIVDHNRYHVINQLLIKKVSSIVMIEQHVNFLPEMCMIVIADNQSIIHRGITAPYKSMFQLPPLVPNINILKKNHQFLWVVILLQKTERCIRKNHISSCIWKRRYKIRHLRILHPVWFQQKYILPFKASKKWQKLIG